MFCRAPSTWWFSARSNPWVRSPASDWPSAEIQPAVVVAQGRALPTVEIFDSATGRTDVFVSSIARLSFIKNMTTGQ